MVYDTARQREVLFENLGNYYDSPESAHPPVTWELVGEDWVRRFLPEPTPWYSKGCMAYDAALGKTVLFGGLGNDETWEYDGTTWTKKDLAVRPPSRWRCGMAYDAARQVIVMFGGEKENLAPLGDTWEYDGTSWVQRTFKTQPLPRSEPAMSYDTDRHVTVLHGGLFYGDTWEYDGRRWVKQNVTTSPSAQTNATMAYDPVHQRTILFGGYASQTFYNETWAWDGSQWSQLFPTESPSIREGMSLVWDPQRQAIVGYGGIYIDGVANDAANDTWSFDGTTWTRIAVSGLPPARMEPGLAYDPIRDSLVLYGGGNYDIGPDPNYTDTWLYDAGGWTLQDAAGNTGTGVGTPLIFDSQAGMVRGFSGYPVVGGPGLTPNIHVLDEVTTTWSDLPEYGPDGRSEGAIAYAPELGGLAVFGGDAHNAYGWYPANDTWFFDGTWFTQRFPAHVPAARMWHGLTYDSRRRRLVLFGGSPDGGVYGSFGDTWIYDGTDWQELYANSAPGGRQGISLAYDAARDRVVMFGDGPPDEGVTWEFDGTNWVAMPTPFMPEATRCWEGLAYDTKREVTWLFGGQNCWGLEYSNDTWAYGPDPDGDGIVGGLDDCPQAANAGQANADGDVAGDACDCAVSDPSAWAPPQPVTGLVLSGSSTTTLTWGDQSSSVGPGVVYDVATSDLIALHQTGSFTGATCLASHTAVPSASDGRTPGPGSAYWYLVRARNVCGVGSYGPADLDALAPCP